MAMAINHLTKSCPIITLITMDIQNHLTIPRPIMKYMDTTNMAMVIKKHLTIPCPIMIYMDIRNMDFITVRIQRSMPPFVQNGPKRVNAKKHEFSKFMKEHCKKSCNDCPKSTHNPHHFVANYRSAAPDCEDEADWCKNEPQWYCDDRCMLQDLKKCKQICIR